MNKRKCLLFGENYEYLPSLAEINEEKTKERKYYQNWTLFSNQK